MTDFLKAFIFLAAECTGIAWLTSCPWWLAVPLAVIGLGVVAIFSRVRQNGV